MVFGEDIVLDEEAFETAIRDFEALGDKLRQLREDIEDMLNLLKTGFNTPAGRKLLQSCEKNLFEPMDAQEIVLKHIAETLAQSKQAYQPVFQEYEALQEIIRKANV